MGFRSRNTMVTFWRQINFNTVFSLFIFDDFFYFAFELIIILYYKLIKIIKYQVLIAKHDIENTVLKCICRQNAIHDISRVNNCIL